MNTDHIIETPFLYVYTTFKKRTGEGDGIIWVCHHCCYSSKHDEHNDMVFETKGDLMVHLSVHQKDGHGVPDALLNRLAREIHETLPEKAPEEPMVVINVNDPEWKEYLHRPTAVCAFQWEHSMEDCIPQIAKVEGQFIMVTHWGDKRRMRDGDWIVRSPIGEVWLVDNGKFKRYYDALK